MSEQADIHIWKHRRQISSSWKSNCSNSHNNHRHKSSFFLENIYSRQQRGKIQLHQPGRNNRRRRKLLTFPLHLKLNFNRFGERRNSLTTGHTGITKAYLCSVKKRSISEAGSNTGIDIQKFKQKMANTLSVMTNVLRNVVSKQRIRYKEKGFNLDLAYVCDNIIAMGYPAEKYESMYRNRLEDVYKFLEENHGDHYKIYNLCLERSYDINKFHGRVSVYPFEDHNPPTIELIQKFCEDIDTWLKADGENVAAVHCKAGKGRTGTMICCYLLFSGQQRSAEDALSCYDEKRTKDRKGVTIPSQRRYVQYFSKLIRSGLPYERRTLQFCEIRFSEPNSMQCFGIVHCSISVLHDMGCTVKVQPLQQNLIIDFRKTCVLDMKNPPFAVAGDIKVELTKSNKKLLHFWFNTFFVTDSAVVEGEGNDVKYIYTLHKWEIDDAHKDKEHKCFSEDFKVDLVFNIGENNMEHDDMQVASSNRLTSNNYRATSQCPATSIRLPHLTSVPTSAPTTQSNNYSLPQNNSSGSEMNFLCDQKSLSSTSVSSSLGGGGTTDNSNGYESNIQQQRCGGPQLKSIDVPHSLSHITSSYHCHPFVAAQDTNNAMLISQQPPTTQHQQLQPHFTTPAATNQPTPPGYVMENQNQQQPQNQQQHKNNVLHLQQLIKGGTSVAGTSTANQRHMQRHCADTVGCVAGGSDVILGAKPSGNVTNSDVCYNHSTDSSKTSSVSSQSSSAIGDTEEDWESAKRTTKTSVNVTTAATTKHFSVSSSKDVIHKKPPPPTPPPRQMLLKNANIGGKFHIGRTTSNKAKYNHQRNIKQQKCNGLKDISNSGNANGADVVAVQNSSPNNIKCTSTIPTTSASSTVSNNSSSSTALSTTQEMCHSCLPAGDLTSELQCC